MWVIQFQNGTKISSNNFGAPIWKLKNYHMCKVWKVKLAMAQFFVHLFYDSLQIRATLGKGAGGLIENSYETKKREHFLTSKPAKQFTTKKLGHKTSSSKAQHQRNIKRLFDI